MPCAIRICSVRDEFYHFADAFPVEFLHPSRPKLSTREALCDDLMPRLRVKNVVSEIKFSFLRSDFLPTFCELTGQFPTTSGAIFRQVGYWNLQLPATHFIISERPKTMIFGFSVDPGGKFPATSAIQKRHFHTSRVLIFLLARA